jgi:2-dehydro-3-deoxygalactonokinase
MAPAVAGVDWGTSRFRLWLMAPDGTVLAERRSDEGLAEAAARGFAALLEGHLAAGGAPAGLPVVICGMAGSRQGWTEAPYLPVPARLDAVPAAAVRVPGLARPVHILPGLSQANPPDVMRGEETQLLGAGLADGLACLPGTHSKWVTLRGGRVEGFATHMTGELFALLSRHSILRHGLGTAGRGLAFRDAVLAVLDDPAGIGNRLFGLRAAGLLAAADPDAAASRLSGLLVGLELAGAFRGGRPSAVTLIASGSLAPLYAEALAAAGVAAAVMDAEAACRSGLLAAARALQRAAPA